MAVVLGYGGIANTNGARDFSTKVVAVSEGGSTLLAREERKPTWSTDWRRPLEDWSTWFRRLEAMWL